jgi:DNA-binding MarR family transcriptional regulator
MADILPLRVDSYYLNWLRERLLGMIREDTPDLTCRQMGVLLICCNKPIPLSAAAIAEKLNVERPTITRAMDRLEALELARRRPNPADARSVLLVPSAKGRAMCRRLARG